MSFTSNAMPFLFCAVCWGGAIAHGGTMGDSLLAKLEEIQKFESDLTCRARIVQEKTGQGTKTTDVEYYRRDSDKAFLIHMVAPESERGNGYLRTGENLWMYRRNTRSFQHINRDESIGGSDAKADDFETRNIAETYAVAKDKDGKEMIVEENLGKLPVYRIEVKAKVQDVDYPRKIWWISRDKNLLMKEEAYSGKTLMQTAYYFKYTQLGGKYIPVKQMFIDEFEKGSRTVVDLSGMSTKKIDGSLFTKAHLESLSK
jgi:outer membrane lipoprotein-sorting protein